MTRFYLRRISLAQFFKKIKLFFKWSFKHSVKSGVIVLLCIFLIKNDLSFQLNLNSVKTQFIPTETRESFSILQPLGHFFESGKGRNKTASNTPNDYSNMTYQQDAKNVSNFTASGAEKIKLQQNYVKRFAEVARAEMKKYDIPASITLAQGLIESNAGESPLSVENNNHFGIKCFSKSCHKGHCSNFTDDSHKDFFRIYGTAWESYRAHSIMLGGDRYKDLKKLKKSDYKGWAHGLQNAGYATDKDYAEKLIHIIEEMELYQFDN